MLVIGWLEVGGLGVVVTGHAEGDTFLALGTCFITLTGQSWAIEETGIEFTLTFRSLPNLG